MTAAQRARDRLISLGPRSDQRSDSLIILRRGIPEIVKSRAVNRGSGSGWEDKGKFPVRSADESCYTTYVFFTKRADVFEW